ncbi:MAG: thioesterase family protein, partial [Actinomycetota bacterium]
MTKFDDETALRRIGDGHYEGELSPDWSIVRGANGGHLAAILLRGMTLAVDDKEREPRSLTVHFARVPKNERINVHTTIERTGRTMSNVSARMEQDGKLMVIALAAFGTTREGPDFSDLTMPEVPGPETITRSPDRPDFPFGHHFDFRPAMGPDFRSPHVAVDGDEGVPAEIALWIRTREPQPVDHVVVTQLMDAFAPAVFAKLGAGGGGAGVPTVEMTTHFRESLPIAGEPIDGWNLGLFRTLTSRGGFIEEDGWL